MQSNDCPFDIQLSTPAFLQEAEQLADNLKQLSPLQLKRLMHISANLAETTKERMQSWGFIKVTPAWYTFIGDVYTGLKISEFTKADLEFAQQHLGTISGLYGVLKPLDAIHPYRLELGYKLKGSANRKKFKDLYDFWGNKIANHFPKDEVIINLSSEEYIKVFRPFMPQNQIITPWFLQLKNGEPDFQAVHAKMARGMMARWITKNKINDPRKLKDFNYGGYEFSSVLSTSDKPTFTRPEGYDFRADY